MRQQELVNSIALKMGGTKKSAKEGLDAVLNAIEEALKAGEKISFNEFGVFEVRDISARKGRNPQTQEEIEIPAYKKPSFRASKILKAKLNGEV